MPKGRSNTSVMPAIRLYSRCGLRGQRDRQSGDTRAGQQAGDRHAEAVKHGDTRKQADQRVKDVLKKVSHRLICF